MGFYLVLRKIVESSPRFTELASAGLESFTPSPPLPFDAHEKEMDEREAGEERSDPGVKDVIESIPFTLIEPVSESEAGPGETAWGLEAVGATSCQQTGAGVTVAVLDSGIEHTHEAFAGLNLSGDNLVDFTQKNRVTGSAPDKSGHGTHVAGIIFGRPVNGTRIGVAPGIKRVLIGKVLGAKAGTTVIYHAIQWALEQGADIISMSLGVNFPGYVQALAKTEKLPVDIASSRALEAYRSNIRLFDRIASVVSALGDEGKDCLLVAAAGNSSRRGENPNYTVTASPPAAAEGFLSVGAVGRSGDAFTVAPFSNTGCRVTAPGVDILSAKLGGGLVKQSGTSMAAPHVAGVLALWVEKMFPGGYRPKGWAADVMQEMTVKALPGLARTDVGRGIVQAPK